MVDSLNSGNNRQDWFDGNSIEKYPGLPWYKCRLDSPMPCSKKCFRPAEIGIEMSSKNDSQFLSPDSQRRCSVIAPMPWICINVFWSIIQPISGFCQILNSQYIYDKSSENGHPRIIFVWINGKLLHYNISWRNDIFNRSAAIINNVCVIILILFFKLGISVLSGSGMYLENWNGY